MLDIDIEPQVYKGFSMAKPGALERKAFDIAGQHINHPLNLVCNKLARLELS